MSTQTTEERVTEATGGWSLGGALLAALAASVCCIGPLVLLALGVGGAWASSLRVVEPYRPIFIVVTLAFLGFAFYRAYRTPATAACSADGSCVVPRSHRLNRIALWVMTPIILALVAFPYIAPHLLAGQTVQKGGNAMNTQEAVLTIENMTCGSCAAAARQSLVRLDGVKDANVTVDPPQAVVTYDPTKISPDALAKATAAAGYPATVKR